MPLHRLFAWLPADQRKPLLQRLLIVWAVSLPIAVVTWMGHQSEGLQQRFDVSLVYSFSISSCIWLLTDVIRFGFKGWLQSQAPHYWPPALPATVMLLAGIPLGYGLGTLVGDAYSGQSTWALLHLNPNRFVGLLVSSASISAAFVAFFYQRGKVQSLRNQATEAQLMLLQSQLEPHMLFNTLANLRALIGSNPGQAAKMLDHLVAYLRATLQASRTVDGKVHHTLEDEFARLQDYLALMAIRMGPRLNYSLDLPENLRTQAIAPLLLQPLVENAIRHGLEPQVKGGYVNVKATEIQGLLCITVQDNGVGCDTLMLSKAQGFGLAQLHQRMNTLHGRAGEIKCLSTPGQGTLVKLKWPVEYKPTQTSDHTSNACLPFTKKSERVP